MREKVYLPDDTDRVSRILYGERDPEWKHIEEETTYTDLSKGYEDIDVVLQRKSDNKYFKFSYATNHELPLDASGLSNDWPLQGEEVFPEIITKTVYK